MYFTSLYLLYILTMFRQHKEAFKILNFLVFVLTFNTNTYEDNVLLDRDFHADPKCPDLDKTRN